MGVGKSGGFQPRRETPEGHRPDPRVVQPLPKKGPRRGRDTNRIMTQRVRRRLREENSPRSGEVPSITAREIEAFLFPRFSVDQISQGQSPVHPGGRN